MQLAVELKQFTSWRRVSSALTLAVGFFSAVALGGRALTTDSCGGIPFVGASHVAAAETKLEPKSGEQIFRELCAKCHGAKGEGTAEHHPRQLMGDKSTAELADVIAKTMPEDDPSKCVGDDAKRVAEYMQSAFYSPEAQARLNPPRIELSRLTVRQYRHAVADVVNSFRSPLTWSTERGLRGEYYKSRRYRGDERVLEQVDSVVKFDFGEESPVKDKIDPVEFALRWQGSVFAPETGEYEFVIRTENGARLWVNDVDKPLIDAWVKSGKDVTERRETIWLLGGRVYPIKLEMFKSKEAKEKRASIALLWKQPHRAVELIPSQYLAPVKNPESLVIETPFPPDDRSIGYERGTAISKAWDQATTDAAIEAAAYIGSHLRELSGAREGDANRAEALKKFCAKFAERAFRRPLTDEQRAIVVDRQFSANAAPAAAAAPDAAAGPGGAPAAIDLDLAVKRSVLLVLMSPRFLYRELTGPSLDSYDVASRLSFGMWDSLPDEELLKAAAADGLRSREQVAAQAQRMLADIRARGKLREFLVQWLRLDQLPDLAKDPKRFPEFTPEIESDLRSSLDLFLDDVVWGEAADFRQLLLSDSIFLNGRLAKFYGVELPEAADFQRLPLDAGQRAGVLSHPLLMAGFAYTSESSPIHRGVFLSRSILGRSLRPPPEAAAPLAPDLHPDLTTRERVMLQTKPESCQSCHGMINPLGFTLEHFDAVGRFRQQEQGKPVDSSGTYLTRGGELKKFGGVRELAAFLADSEETQTSFATQLFHYLVKQPIRAFGPTRPAELRSQFAADQFHIRKLMVEILASSALAGVEPKK